MSQSAGAVKLDGRSITGFPDARAAQASVMCRKGRDIFPHLTVEENLHIGAIAHGKKANGELDRVLTLFPDPQGIPPAQRRHALAAASSNNSPSAAPC